MDLTKFEGKFFGPLQIKKVTLLKDKTYSGNKRVNVEYTSDEKEELPLDVLEKTNSVQPIDLSELREQRVIPVVEDLIKVLADSELGHDDIQYAIGLKLSESINMAADTAQEMIYGKHKSKVSLMDLQKILKKKNV